MLTTTRRALLGAGLGGGAGAVAACSASKDPAPSSPAPGAAAVRPSATLTVPDFDPADWSSVRAQFPLDAGAAQFAAFVLSPHTRQVESAVEHHRARLAFDTEGVLLEGIEAEGRVRAAAAEYVVGDPSQIALTESTTMGIALMYGGLRLRPSDRVLTTTHDFYSTNEALRLATSRTGAGLDRVTLYDDPAGATVDEMTSRLVAGIGDRTRVVAVTWVHSGTGVRLPIAEMGRAIANLNSGRDEAERVLFCVDGVHGFGAVDVDLPELGCDFLATGTHKWLFGPRGTGILWGRDWAPLTELIPTFSGPDDGARLSPGGYHAFEHRWALDQAFAFQQRIGRTRVVERTVEQASALKEGLAGVAGVTVVTPRDPEVSAGIVCVDLAATPPPEAVLALREAGVVTSVTPYATPYVRLGPSIVTSPEDVESAVAAVAELA